MTLDHFLFIRPVNSKVHDSKLKFEAITKKLFKLFLKNVKDYLKYLQQRGKRMIGKDNLEIYDLVFIIEDNVAFCNCPLGKDVDLF